MESFIRLIAFAIMLIFVASCDNDKNELTVSKLTYSDSLYQYDYSVFNDSIFFIDIYKDSAFLLKTDTMKIFGTRVNEPYLITKNSLLFVSPCGTCCSHIFTVNLKSKIQKHFFDFKAVDIINERIAFIDTVYKIYDINNDIETKVNIGNLDIYKCYLDVYFDKNQLVLVDLYGTDTIRYKFQF